MTPRLLPLLLSLFLGFATAVQADDRPNFIFFITDDISWDDLGCYGNDYVKTPNLDAMAAEGMRFTQAYLTISSCSPSRCSIITGRYPHNTGAPELHTDLPEQPTFVGQLKESGYYTALSGKHHMGDAVDPHFDLISKGKGPGKEEDWVEILAERPQDQPFFCWFASADAHRKWNFDDNAPIYDPETVPVPPFLYDGPKTRQDLADYYHEVSRTDYFMGKLREELKRQGILENTYIIYTADNGRPFPRSKVRLYDSGIKTPFLVSCPTKIEPAVCDSLVSTLDIAPTILQLAGLEKTERMQGVSFVPLLENPKAKIRDYAFAEHNWHVFSAHERMVRFGDYIYIKNNRPELQSLNMESDPSFPAGEELWEMHAAGKLNENQKDIFQIPRPEEELYRVSKDPHQFTNLADNPEYAATLEEARGLMTRWVEETGDTVPADPTPDRQDLEGTKNPDFEYRTFPGTEKNAIEVNAAGPILAE